jgi:hypothetical protein
MPRACPAPPTPIRPRSVSLSADPLAEGRGRVEGVGVLRLELARD